ncbi:MAG: glycosyltransferase family A protein [Candidatus Auribacterota bacterium]|nr:glycosyltransferase family A protein [Candidatus Auribacterota bacterium]
MTADIPVSIIIPVYNRQSMLERAITSVLRQTYTAFELIVVDDGSDEPLCEVAEKFADKRIRFVKQLHKGVSAARNYGVSLARHTHIAFLDSDDEWLDDKLQQQMCFLTGQPAYRICYTGEQWIRHGKTFDHPKSREKFSGYIFEQCLNDCFIGCSTVVMEKSLFVQAGGFDTSLAVCEDYDLWLKISARYPIVLLDNRLIRKHGGHDDQLSRAVWGIDRFRIFSIKNILKSGRLSDRQSESARRVLHKKTDIVCGGCLKRGRFDGFAQFIPLLLNKYTQLEWNGE